MGKFNIYFINDITKKFIICIEFYNEPFSGGFSYLIKDILGCLFTILTINI